jgi:putative membrane protein
MLLLSWIINALSLFLVTLILPGFQIANFYYAMIAALFLGLVNIVIRPILLLLTLPINLLTLGIFTFVINALMLLLVSHVIRGFTIDTFATAFKAAILLWLMSFLTNSLQGMVSD